MKKLLLLFGLLISINAYSQLEYEFNVSPKDGAVKWSVQLGETEDLFSDMYLVVNDMDLFGYIKPLSFREELGQEGAVKYRVIFFDVHMGDPAEYETYFITEILEGNVQGVFGKDGKVNEFGFVITEFSRK